MAISYTALVPNFPPLIPPVPPVGSEAAAERLKPHSDQVSQVANYTGHGLGATFDLQFPLAPRVSIVTGLAIGLIRGAESSAYTSETSYYALSDSLGVPLTKDQLF